MGKGAWRQRLVLGAGFLLAAALVGGILFAAIGTGRQSSHGEDGVSSAGQSRPTDLVTVRTVLPQRLTLRRTTTQPGTVHGFFEANLHARATGYLKELRVDIGDRVEANQALGVIDVPEMERKRERFQAEVLRAEAEELRIKSELEVARAQIASQKAQVEQAQAAVQKTEATLVLQRAEFRRVDDLVKGRAIDEQIRDESRSRLESAQAARREAEAAGGAAQAALAVAEARFKAAEANLQVAAACIRIAQKELAELNALIDYATLRSPFQGVVTARSVELGDLVKNADGHDRTGNALFTVAQLDKVRIRIPVPERDVSWVDVGDNAEFKPSSVPARMFPGKVARFASKLDANTRTMLVEVDFANPDQRLLPGMFGQVTLFLEDRSDCIVLPTSALRYDEAGKGYVFVVGDDGKVGRVDVSTGLDDGQRIEIVRGLSGSERVITSQTPGLSPGQMVRAVAE